MRRDADPLGTNLIFRGGRVMTPRGMRRVLFLLALSLPVFFPAPAHAAQTAADANAFPPTIASYHDSDTADVGTVLADRIKDEPFNLVATIIFLLAIIHTFFASKILAVSHRLQHDHDAQLRDIHGPDVKEKIPRHLLQSIPAALLHFLGEVETVFGIWVIPLALALAITKGPAIAKNYLDYGVSYIEPLFVVIIMAIAASRPIVQLAVFLLRLVARESIAGWWLAVLTLGPLLGSFITEPAAMTICAVLLGREFYRLEPSHRFMYATLGLLFVNISVGGALTNFAAPPILIVAAKWHWSTPHLLHDFGWRALAGIIVSNIAYFMIFRKEFAGLTDKRRNLPDEASPREPIPFWITGVHLAFLGWTVLVAHEPALFIGGFLFFLAFTMASTAYQDDLDMRSPMLVGFFLAGLVVHGGLQAWWIQPVLSRLGEYPLLFGATVLTAFNDNATITYLATLVPSFSEPLRAAVVSGAICGGGLTIIANAPNPAGQSLLQKYFPEGSIAPGGLLLAALGPTLVMLFFFALPR
jgi:hypothetical protein